ncbi:MAG: VOC family protein [Candidatus Competibacter sp.]
MVSLNFQLKTLKISKAPNYSLSPVYEWTYKSWGDDYADTQDRGISSGINLDSENRPTHPFAIIYIDNLEVISDKIEMASGTITKEIFSFPGGRRFHFKDPVNNELAVWSDQNNL